MFDIGWSELLLIGIVALIVVGPKELPGLFRTMGQFMGRARGMAREFQRSMEQAADESGLNEAAGGLKGLNRLNLNSATNSARKYANDLVKQTDLTLKETPEVEVSKIVKPETEAPKTGVITPTIRAAAVKAPSVQEGSAATTAAPAKAASASATAPDPDPRET